MRLPAPRARRRSTVLGEPFLRAVSTGTPNAAEPDPEPPQPAETPEPQPLDPFRAMFNLFNACQQADAEIAEIEETLAVDPDALLPEAIVAPAQKLLAQTQSDIERLPPGKASEHVIRTARREGLAVSGRVLEADARANTRFTTGAINDAADRLAARVAEDPATLKPSLKMLNDLIETADLEPGEKQLIAANLQRRVRDATEPLEASPDATAAPFEDELTGLDPQRLQEIRNTSEDDPTTFNRRATATIEGALARAQAQQQSDQASAQILYRREIARAFGFAILAASSTGNTEFLDDIISRTASLPATGGFRGLANTARRLLAENEGEPLSTDVVANQILQVVAQEGSLEAGALVDVVDPAAELLGAGIANVVGRTLGMVAGSGRGRGGRGNRDREESTDRQRDGEPEREKQGGQDDEDLGDGRRDDRAETQSRRFSADELRQRSPNDAGSFSNVKFTSEEDYLRYRRIVHSGVPRGFRDREHFETVGEKLWEELAGGDGFENARIAIRGSTVTGRKFDRGTEKYEGPLFDTAKKGDFDLAVVDGNLLKRAFRFRRTLNIGFRQGGTRTTPLNTKQLRGLGLNHFAEKVEELADTSERTIEVMIYENDQSLWVRGQAMWLPKGE